MADVSVQSKKRPLSVAWIDYAKAFDSVSHKYIQWVLKAMQLFPTLRLFIRRLMSQWKVKYEIKSDKGKVMRNNFLKIESGVLRGDSFSPLLFCFSMTPFSHALNSGKLHYRTASGKKQNLQLSLSHQFCMGDLKLCTNSKENLKKLRDIVHIISKPIRILPFSRRLKSDVVVNICMGGCLKCKTRDVEVVPYTL